MSGVRPLASGAWTQSIDLAFTAIFVLVVLLGVGWAVAGVHRVGPGEQAVVYRFGAAVGTHGPGLLVTFPAPIERVEIVPGPDQLIEKRLARFAAAADGDTGAVYDPHRNAGFVLTGDTGLAGLEAALFYSVTSAPAYLAQRQQLDPALDRLAGAALTAVAAGRDLDAVLVARPEASNGAEAAGQREHLRGALVAEINRRLRALEANGGLGIGIVRIDLTARLPEVLRPAYDGVLTAIQKSDQELAIARTTAARFGQNAQQGIIAIRTQAESNATQRLTDAKTRTAELNALLSQTDTLQRVPLLARIFQERIGRIMEQAGGVTLVNPDLPLRLILPGTPPESVTP